MKSTMVRSGLRLSQAPLPAIPLLVKPLTTSTCAKLESTCSPLSFVLVSLVRVGKSVPRPKRLTLDLSTYYERPSACLKAV